jgi:CRISPR-associated protein Cmr2
MKEDLFILKAACLLHDPPTKAWDIVKRRSHEEMAKRIAENILKESRLNDAKNLLKNDNVKQADYLAAGVDRWLLSKLVGEDYSSFRYDEIKIKNIFNPKFLTPIRREPEDKQVNDFTKKLNYVLKGIQDVNLAYHVLYACYEPYWILSELPSGPADTRTPSHNVFDHNYATASIMNWLVREKEPKGILLYVDLGGPQRFISSSRKLRDLWVSSYLASALAWNLFWFLIKRLGPDIMILPTCRGNPFYYHILISELRQSNVKGEIIDEIKRLVKEITEGWYNPYNDVIPKYAVIPVTATFMLPDIDVLKQFDDFEDINNLEDLKELIKKKYEEAWEKIYEVVVGKCKELINDFGILAEKASELLEDCKNYGFDKVPPLPLRIIAIHINELYDLGFLRNEKERYKLYHYIFKLLTYRVEKEKVYKFRPEEELKLYDITLKPLRSWKESKRGFDYCSVCGSLPAIVIMPSNEKGFKKEKLGLKIEPIFGFGERLCFYCLIKRLLTMNKLLKPFIDLLLGKISDNEINFRFLSVCDIAVLPFKKSLIEIGVKLSDHHPDLAETLSNKIDNIWKQLAERKISPPGRQPIMKVEQELLNKIKETVKIDDLRKNLEEFLYIDSEIGIMRGMDEYNPRKDWRKIKDELNENMRVKLFGRIEELNTYYATIRSDADNFGKIIQGKVKEGFRIEIDDYLYNLLEGDAKEVVQAIIDGRYENAKKICEKSKISDIDKKLDEIKKLVEELKAKKEIIISPSYHSALSRALVSNAFNDVKKIENHSGLAVYAGGDDLLAVTPVDECLSVVKELRKNFSFPLPEPKGFYRIKSYYIPSLVTASRSFSVYLSHYMFPMYVTISRSAKLLSEYAKEVRWILHDVKQREKDALVLSYSPRGGEQSAILPLSNVRKPEENLGGDIMKIQELIELIDELKSEFSSSLIYNLNDDEHIKLIESLIKQNKDFLLKKVIEEVFYRNCDIKDKDIKRRKAEDWSSKFTENYDLIFDIDGEHHFFLKELTLSLKLYRSGLREAA